jgi:hypothetical protein
VKVSNKIIRQKKATMKMRTMKMGETNDDILPAKWLGALMMDDERRSADGYVAVK